MSKANCYISGSSWFYNFVERSSHCLRYITKVMTEKLYRVLVDAGDMTSLQSIGNFTTRGVHWVKSAQTSTRSHGRTPSLSMSF